MLVLKIKPGGSLCGVVCSGLDGDVSIVWGQHSRFVEEMRLVRAKAFFIPCHHRCSFKGRTPMLPENVIIRHKKQERIRTRAAAAAFTYKGEDPTKLKPI